MGIGILIEIANMWLAADPDSYEALHIEDADGYAWFYELPDWAYSSSTTDGPFNFDEKTGALYNTSLRPSQAGYFLGNIVQQ